MRYRGEITSQTDSDGCADCWWWNGWLLRSTDHQPEFESVSFNS